MSSAYSILRNYGSYVQPYDMNFIQKGLEFKQNKFDANAAKIQSQIDQFASISLAKSEDKEYLNTRMQTLVDQTNQYGKMDLSSNGISRNIENHMKQILDENVMNAHQSTRNMQQYLQSEEWYKKNRPKEYNDLNTAYSREPLNEWLNDGQVGTSYKGGTYQPYVNLQKQQFDFFTKLYKESGSTTTVPQIGANGQPTGRMITKKVKGLSQDEINNLYNTSLTPQGRKQMQINAWGVRKTVEGQQAVIVGTDDTNDIRVQARTKVFFDNQLNSYIDGKKDLVQAQIDRFKAEGNKEMVKQLNNSLRGLDTAKDEFGSDIVTTSNYLEQARNQATISNAFSKRVIDLEYGSDDFYWKVKNYALDLKKFQLKTLIAANKTGAATGTPTSFDQTISGATELDATKSGYDRFLEGSTETKNKLDLQANKLLNTDFKNQKSDIDRSVQLLMSEKGIDYNTALTEEISRRIGKQSKKSNNIDEFQNFQDASNFDINTVQQRTDNIRSRFKEVLQSKGVDILKERTNYRIRNKYQKFFGTDNLTDNQLYEGLILDTINSKLDSNDDRNLKPLLGILSELHGGNYRFKSETIPRTIRTADGTQTVFKTVLSLEGQGKGIDVLKQAKRAGLTDDIDFFGFDDDAMDDSGIRSLLNSNTITEQVNKEMFALGAEVSSVGLSASPFTSKGVLRMSQQQEVLFSILGNALNNSDLTTISDNGEFVKKEDLGKKFNMSDFNTNKNLTITLLPKTNEETIIRLSNGKEIKTSTKLVADLFFKKTGQRLDLSTLNTQGTFLKRDVDFSTKMSGLSTDFTKSLINDNFEYFEKKAELPIYRGAQGTLKLGQVVKSPQHLFNSLVVSNTVRDEETLALLAEVFSDANNQKLQNMEFNMHSPRNSNSIMLRLKDKETSGGGFVGSTFSFNLKNNAVANSRFNEMRDLSRVHSNVGMFYYLNSLLQNKNNKHELKFLLQELNGVQ